MSEADNNKASRTAPNREPIELVTPPNEQAEVTRRRLSVARVAEMLHRKYGNVSATAEAFGVARSSLYSFIDDHTELKQVLTDSREEICDNAELALHAAVKKGEGWAVCFTLKTLGRHRGYVERQEIEHSGGVVMEIVEEIVNAPEEVRRPEASVE